MQEIFYPSSDGGTLIRACVWRPQGEPRAIFQIVHGMCEYSARYSAFAEELAARGYLVCAEDHLGHGKSVRDSGKLGYFDGTAKPDAVIADIHKLRHIITDGAPGCPYVIMGHSMGSFLTRIYLSRYGDGVSAAVIMGTGFKSPSFMNIAVFITKLNAAFCGWENRSAFIKKLAFGSYNKKFGKGCDKNAWLSADEDNVKKYNADPLCNFSFTDCGYAVLFRAIRRACGKKTINAVPRNLPLLFVAGEDDPVGDYGKGVKKAAEKYKKAGAAAEVILYGGARHEILNDFCKKQVTEDILAFADKHTGGSGK